ncbi:MAG: LamG-like jellyroll fold domain-containing protein, partial [Verrucomicrobiota bacterium]
FSHSTSNSPVVIEQEGPYLFLGAFFCDNDTTARQVSLQEWTIDGIPSGYGGASQYSRHAGNFNNGNWSGFIGQLSVSNRVEVNASRLAAGGLLPGHSLGLQGAGIVSLCSNAVLVVKEGLGIAAGTIEIVDPQLLRAVDASAPPSNIVYTVETDPTGGTLRNNGVALSAGGTFTQDDIDQGLLRFEAGTVLGSGFGFGFSLSSGGGSHPAGFFLITVAEAIVMVDETGTSDEDSPITTLDGGLGNLFANDSGDGLTLSTFDATSANGARVSVGADGTFSYDPSQAIALQALGNGDTLMDPFTYTLVDAIGKSATGTATIAVGGVEDPFAAGDVVVDDSANRLLENAGPTAISIALAANDGIVRTANATTNDILICNYDARGSIGINTWQNLGSLGGADMDWILRPGVTHDREVSSARAGITAAYHWDGSPDATAILRGIASVNDILGPGVDQANASLEFWVKLDTADLGQVSTLFETGGGTGSGIVIDHGVLKAANGILIAETRYDLLVDSLGLLGTGPTGEFFQVLWTMDLSNDVSSLYVNGVFVDSSPNTTTDWDGGDPSGLGHFQGNNHGGFQNTAAGTAYDTYYHGSMAIFRIYREALSPAEVFQNFQAIDSGATDMEGDTLSLLGLYDATGTLVPGTGTAITLASGGTVTLDTASGDFTYDPSGIPNLDDMSFGQSLVDAFTYRVGDGNGLSDDAQVSLVIYGLNNAVDDTLAATETLVTTFMLNQLVGNDQHPQAAADPYLAFDAALVSAAEQAAGTWANAGSSGAASDATIWAGNLLAPPSGFGALAQSWDHLEASLASLDAISTQDTTFELWFKPVPGSGSQVLFESGGAGTGMSLVYDADLHQVIATLDGGTD